MPVVAVLALLLVVALSEMAIRNYNMAHSSHGWYVVVDFYGRRGSLLARLTAGGPYAERLQCDARSRYVAQRLQQFRSGIACVELFPEEASLLEPIERYPLYGVWP